MNDNLPPPLNPGYRGPVLVDPANDRPALNPQYRTPWPDPTAEARPWLRSAGDDAARLGRLLWLALMGISALVLLW